MVILLLCVSNIMCFLTIQIGEVGSINMDLLADYVNSKKVVLLRFLVGEGAHMWAKSKGIASDDTAEEEVVLSCFHSPKCSQLILRTRNHFCFSCFMHVMMAVVGD